MQILITNDDGIHATGLQILAEAASTFGDVLIVAPHEERSACSHAITLHAPLRLLPMHTPAMPQRFAVNGTPTDCAYLGLHEVSPRPVDLLLSGINHGPNLGVDVLYSGTVAAAMEGARAGVRSVAISLNKRTQDPAVWQRTKRAVIQILAWILSQPPLPEGRLLNVNLPVALAEKPSIMITRLGQVVYPPEVDTRRDPKGGAYYWIGGKGPVYGDEPGTDCVVIQEGQISVTPLQLDLTDTPTLQGLRSKRQLDLDAEIPARDRRGEGGA